MTIARFHSALLAFLVVSGMGSTASSAAPFDRGHRVYAMVLDRFVKNGLVSYTALKANPRDLTLYLDAVDELSEQELQRWDANERLALLLNLYNATTLQVIIDAYPVKSIKDIGILPMAVWRKDSVRLHHSLISLQALENTLIRAKYPDHPEVHFALVCAALGCPLLRSEPYIGTRLQEQLDDQARLFLADPEKNRVIGVRRVVVVSKIFKWYESDFTRNGKSVVDNIEKFFPAEAREELKAGGFRVEYSDYDWNLNDSRSIKK